MGGKHVGTLPVGLRIASGVAGAVVYPLLILVVLEAGGRIVVSWLPDDTTLLLWVLAGFFLLGTVMNLVSRSKPERIWGPVSLVVAVCCGTAFTPRPSSSAVPVWRASTPALG